MLGNPLRYTDPTGLLNPGQTAYELCVADLVAGLAYIGGKIIINVCGDEPEQCSFSFSRKSDKEAATDIPSYPKGSNVVKMRPIPLHMKPAIGGGSYCLRVDAPIVVVQIISEWQNCGIKLWFRYYRIGRWKGSSGRIEK